MLGVRSGYLAKAEVVINTKVLDKVETQCQPPTWSRGFDGTERESHDQFLAHKLWLQITLLPLEWFNKHDPHDRSCLTLTPVHN